jgi:NAD-dependent dihydropyrimidine dehydrogenase PreA subunit
MTEPICPHCQERDRRIAELEARLAEQERFRRETVYLRDEAKSERDLRSLTGASQAMKSVRAAIQQVTLDAMLYIDAGECIDCEACVPECPVEAIFHDTKVPAPWTQFIQLNLERVTALKSCGHITEKQEAKKGLGCRNGLET